MADADVKAHHQEPGLPVAAQSHGQPVDDASPIVSRFIDDDIYRPLLVEFVSDLPGHVTEIRAAADAGQHQEAGRLSHRLKGAAATYGYPELAGVAAELEDLIVHATKTGESVEAEQLAEITERMGAVTRRIELGTRQWDPTTPLQ